MGGFGPHNPHLAPSLEYIIGRKNTPCVEGIQGKPPKYKKVQLATKIDFDSRERKI